MLSISELFRSTSDRVSEIERMAVWVSVPGLEGTVSMFHLSVGSVSELRSSAGVEDPGGVHYIPPKYRM